jgi:hypothetical protein
VNTDSLTLQQLQHQLALRRITLTTSSGKLIADDPAERLTPMLDRAIRHHREALLSGTSTEFPQLLYAVKRAVFAKDLKSLVDQSDTALAAAKMTATEHESLIALAADRARQIPFSVEDMPLPEFAESGLICEVHSHVLGEDVLFAADNAQIPADNSLVVYRAAERQKLAGASPGMLKAVHAVKKQLDGEVVEPTEDAVEISAAMLLKSGAKPSQCSACGQDRWWRQNGRRICGVCHPPPSAVGRSDRANQSRGERQDEGQTS